MTRSAWQRLYDLVLSYGTYPVEGSKEDRIRYRFFDDPENDGRDAIFGLTKPLMELVNVFQSAARNNRPPGERWRKAYANLAEIWSRLHERVCG